MQTFAFPHSTLKLSEYQKQDWQIEDGLPDNNVRMIAQRADGSLILATGSGLAAFDGTRFLNLPVELNGHNESEAINAILFGPDPKSEDLWIGTDGRGVLHQTAGGTVNISELAGHFNERARTLLLASDGALWIATQNGVERYFGNRLQALAGCGMISGDLTSVFAEDDTGGMFFVTSAGLYRWQHGVARRVALPLSPGDTVVALYRDPRHRLWVGTMSGVLELIPRVSGERGGQALAGFDPVLRAKVPSPVTVLLADSEENLWIGTRHEGLLRLNADGLAHWGRRDGLSDDAIRSLFLDKEQNLWIGLLAGGLSRWRKGALAPFGAPEGFTANYAANAFADSRGDLWLGTWGKGLYRMHQALLEHITLPGLPIATPIRALAEDTHGSIWVGTWFQGLYRIEDGRIRHFLLGTESPGNAISVILADKGGGLWVGTYTGLFYFPSGEPETDHRAQFLPSQLITSLLEDVDGSTLVGTSTGLYRVRPDRKEVFGLTHAYVQSLFQDHLGYAWAGTKTDGVLHIGMHQVTRLATGAGMPDLSVNTGSEDQDGHFWLGTTRGIVRLSVAEAHAVVDGRATQLTTVVLGRADGMRSSECGGPSKPLSTMLPNGTLWFATAKGFVHTTDVAETLGKTIPVATIQGWSNSNDPAEAIQPYDAATSLQLEPGQPDMLLFYNANLLSNPGQVEYRYRLLSYDTQWTTTHSHSARYRRLPPGNYRFEVQARISGEQWTSAIDSVAIRQQPFFYQTWYFEFAVGVAVFLGALALYRRRLQSMKGRLGIILEERSRIASDCHDTLMAGFAAVSWQLEATSKLFRDNGSTSTPAAESCELARSMVSHCQAEARRIIWDLRTTEEVTSQLSEAVERMLAANSMQQDLRCTLAVEGEEQPLPPNSIHHLVCIAQEALSNAIRHASPTQIEIRLRYATNSVLLAVRDNGLGFHAPASQAALHGHFGIAVMEERARKLGGALQIESALGTGTEINVLVSFAAGASPRKEQRPDRWIRI